MRKIAANYIFLPGFPLTKNGYVVLPDAGPAEVVDTGGQIREMAGLEFYGGLIVADFAAAALRHSEEGILLSPFLEACYRQQPETIYRLSLIEGADLLDLKWRKNARIVML